MQPQWSNTTIFMLSSDVTDKGLTPKPMGTNRPRVCLVGITLSNSHPVQTSLYGVGIPNVTL